MIKMHRAWAMPTGDTFSMRPVSAFLSRWITRGAVVVDPFARNASIGTITNDLSPDTSAQYHMDAGDFCEMLVGQGVEADVLLFDPPYSPRQISELYQSVGLPVGTRGTQNAALYKRVRDAADPMVKQGGVVLSFGWNSTGMGVSRGYDLMEVLLVAHGGAHNDTICVAERKQERLL